MNEDKEPQVWKSIKVKEATYEDLKKMGKGISQAVEILVESQKEEIETKIEDIKDVADEVAQILLEHGVFDIRFAGAGVDDIKENGETVTVKGFIRIVIPHAEARAKLIEVLKGKEKAEEESKIDVVEEMHKTENEESLHGTSFEEKEEEENNG